MNEVRIGSVTLGEGRPRICIPICGGDLSRLSEEIRHAVLAGAELLEIRADCFIRNALHPSMAPLLRALPERVPLPMILTFRTRPEGGMGDPQHYVALVLEGIRSGRFDALDLEVRIGEDTFVRLRDLARAQGMRIIASAHDFAATPPTDSMETLFDNMDRLEADVLKLAVMPAGMEDVLRLLLALERTRQHCQRPLIGIAMGKPGIVTRLMCEAFGSCLTFAAADAQSAPGQIRAEDLAGILRIIHQTLESEGENTP